MRVHFLLSYCLGINFCISQTAPPAPKIEIINFIRHNGGPDADAAVFLQPNCGCDPGPYTCNEPTLWWIKDNCGGNDIYLGYGHRADLSLNKTTTYVAQCFRDGVGGPKSEITIMVNKDPNYDDCQGPNREVVDRAVEQYDRKDYHYYSRERLICDKTVPGCTVDGVYNSLLTDVRNTAPDGEIIEKCLEWYEKWGIGFSKYLYPRKKYAVPITDCQGIVIARPDNMTVMAITGSRRVCENVNVDLFANNYISGDPVFLKTDSESKCITNYTLPGHIFYPGKVTRCIRDNDVIFPLSQWDKV